MEDLFFPKEELLEINSQKQTKTDSSLLENYVIKKLNNALGINIKRISSSGGVMDGYDSELKIRLEIKSVKNEKINVCEQKFIRDQSLNPNENLYIYVNIALDKVHEKRSHQFYNTLLLYNDCDN